jgi:hypothetical protein
VWDAGAGAGAYGGAADTGATLATNSTNDRAPWPLLVHRRGYAPRDEWRQSSVTRPARWSRPCTSTRSHQASVRERARLDSGLLRAVRRGDEHIRVRDADHGVPVEERRVVLDGRAKGLEHRDAVGLRHTHGPAAVVRVADEPLVKDGAITEDADSA